MVFFYFFWQMSTGANETHVTDEDTPKLWKFVETGFAEETAEFGNAGVVFDFY